MLLMEEEEDCLACCFAINLRIHAHRQPHASNSCNLLARPLNMSRIAQVFQSNPKGSSTLSTQVSKLLGYSLIRKMG